MNDIEIWLSEYQESNAILIEENSLPIVQKYVIEKMFS